MFNFSRYYRALSFGLLLIGAMIIIWAVNDIQADANHLENQISEAQKQLDEQRTSSLSKDFSTSLSEEQPTSNPKHDDEIEEADAIIYAARPMVGDSVGTLSIPRLEQTLSIIEGTSDKQLDRGVGHYQNSVLPGESDNSVLSGHRDTVFRRLGELEKEDEFIVETSAGTFTYRIKDIKIVDADDKTIIVPTEEAVLTVTTCYPFDFVGDAPERYILVAELVDPTK